jgi:hypothetical protein
VWGGAANAVAMLDTDDNRGRFNRLTFNGNNTVGILVNTAGNNSRAQEFADDVFINAGGTYNTTSPPTGTPAGPIDVACGYDLGATNLITNGSRGGCSEISWLRDRFIAGTTHGTGISGGDSNALDFWVWNSTFTNKGVALNNYQGGDFEAFNNNFSGSTVADISIHPNAEQYYYGNYSSGSAQFLNCVNWNFGDAVVVEKNVVVGTSASSSQLVECDDSGPTVLIDKQFYSKAGATTPVVVKTPAGNSPASDLFSVGNAFTAIGGGVLGACASSSDYVQNVPINANPQRCYAYAGTGGDQSTAASPPSAPSLPGTPPQYCAAGCPNTVAVYEATPSGSGTACSGGSPCSGNQAITSACSAGNGAVAHLQPGTYSLSAVSIPGNTFCQIIGDGISITTLNGANPIITCGPACKAWFRELAVTGSGYSNVGIKLTGSDVANGRVFMERLVAGDAQAGVKVNGLSNANVEIHNSSFDDMGTYGGGDGIGVNVVGASGSPASSTNIFVSSNSGNQHSDVKLTNNGKLTLRHDYHDSGSPAPNGGIADVSGGGSFGFAAAHAYVRSCSMNTGCPPLNGHHFSISGFSGNSAIIGIYTELSDSPADVYINPGAAVGNNLVLGYMGCTNAGLSFTDTSASDNYLIRSQQIFPSGCQDQDGGNADGVVALSTTPADGSQNISSQLSFLTTTLAPLRSAVPTVPGSSGDPALASGVTDARMYRVNGGRTTYVIDVEP